MLKTYSGGCHCGAVRFEADVDIGAGTEKCNCTICAKSRLWAVDVKPDKFRLLAGQADLTDYRGKNPVAHHPFCRRCGVRAFQRVEMPNLSGSEYYNVSITCLEGVDTDELMAAPVTYYDGLNDRWNKTPADTRAL